MNVGGCASVKRYKNMRMSTRGCKHECESAQMLEGTSGHEHKRVHE